MEYYSAIKRNAFESIVMRWMNLEPIIQSEVSQKEKDKYHILTHIWRRQWHPTPVLLPGKFHGRRSLVGAVHGVVKSQTRLSDFTLIFHFHALEKEMATHYSILA